jgi:hypothetical protein
MHAKPTHSAALYQTRGFTLHIAYDGERGWLSWGLLFNGPWGALFTPVQGIDDCVLLTRGKRATAMRLCPHSELWSKRHSSYATTIKKEWGCSVVCVHTCMHVCMCARVSEMADLFAPQQCTPRPCRSCCTSPRHPPFCRTSPLLAGVTATCVSPPLKLASGMQFNGPPVLSLPQ